MTEKRSKKVIITVFALFAFFLCVVWLLCANGSNATAYAQAVQHEQKVYCKATLEDDFEEDVILVVLDKYESDINKFHADDYFGDFEKKSVKDLTSLPNDKKILDRIDRENYRQIYKIVLPEKGKVGVLETIPEIEKIEGVLSASPSYLCEQGRIPNDTFYKDSDVGIWGLNGEYGIGAEQAWDITTGSKDVKVGIIDTGIANHDDLNYNLVVNYDTVNEVEDIEDLVIADNNTIIDDHGSFIGGIIGANGNDGVGIPGVCWNVSLYALKMDIIKNGKSEIYSEPIVNALGVANALGIDIVNCSHHCFSNNTALSSAIENFAGLFICIAGNGKDYEEIKVGFDVDAEDLSYHKIYPEKFAFDNMIVVGAIDSSGDRCSFSNWGKTSVDLFAPGDEIYSTSLNNKYRYGGGTSYAAPFVTGVAALIKSVNPNLTPAEIKAAILDNVDKDDRLTDLCVTGGRLNAFHAVASVVELDPEYPMTFPVMYNINTNKPFTGYVNQCYHTFGVSSSLADGENYHVTGYEFIGWSYKPGRFEDGVGTVDTFVNFKRNKSVKYVCYGRTTLYAVWRAREWTIIEYQNDKLIKEHLVHYDGPDITFDAKGIAGFTFKEWRKQYDNTPNYIHVTNSAKFTMTMNDNMPKDGYSFYFLHAAYEQSECVAAGTLITLADGTQKPVEELTGDELLLVWDMYNGRYDVAPILFIDTDAEQPYDVIRLTFSDGSIVKVISEHGFWDRTLNRYVYLDKYADRYIGHTFEKQGEGVILTDVELTRETTSAYSPVTYGHLCYYVNGMLSMPGGIYGLMNIFEVDPETMTYDPIAMQADIDEYGLFTYEEFCEATNADIPRGMFDGVNGRYLKVAIGKGVVTFDELCALAERYSEYFD